MSMMVTLLAPLIFFFSKWVAMMTTAQAAMEMIIGKEEASTVAATNTTEATITVGTDSHNLIKLTLSP